MKGDLRVFWNVGGGDVECNNREAVAHGFRLVNLLGTYADYPGRQKENIGNALKDNRTNPWKKPDFCVGHDNRVPLDAYDGKARFAGSIEHLKVVTGKQP